MKGNLKKFAALALASGVSLTTCAFVGCGFNEERQLYRNAVSEATESLTSIKEVNNFTLSCYNTESQKLDYYFKVDNDVVEVKFSISESSSYYYYSEDGTFYMVSKDDSGNWNRKITGDTALYNAAQSFSTTLASAIVWSSYDGEENILTGRYYGNTIEMKIENGEIYFKIGKEFYTYTDIGTTIVTLPENVIDNTSEDVISAKLAENDKVL